MNSNIRYIISATSVRVGAAALLTVCGLIATGAAQAQTLNTSSQYNLFTLGNASNSNVDVLGKIAVGGNANFNNYTIGSALGIGSSINAVVGGNYTNTYGTVNGSMAVGGNVNSTDPTVNGNVSANGTITLTNYGSVKGNITYGSSISDSTTTVSGTTSKGTTTLPVNFSTAGTNLISTSQTLQSTATTGTITTDGYGHLSATGTGSLNVYDLSASLLASAYSINFNAASGATVVIDVTGVGGNTITIPNNNNLISVNGTTLNNVIFNFGDATSSAVINLQSFNASILAPLASVQGVGAGQYNGSLIAGSFAGNGIELHNDNLFSGNVGNGGNNQTPPAVPEPGIVVTTVSMLAMTGLGLVRGRRRRSSATA